MSKTATNGQLATAGLVCWVAVSAAGMTYEPCQLVENNHGSYTTEEIIRRTISSADARRATAAASILDAQLALIETDVEPMN